jgi:flagellar basal-body rod protein FlgC
MGVMVKVPSSPLHQAAYVLNQGINNQNVRATIAAQNYVNAQSASVTKGGEPYRRRTVEIEDYVDPKTGVHVPVVRRIGQDSGVCPAVYNPAHPGADPKTGLVKMPNVNPYLESADYQEQNVNALMCGSLYKINSTQLRATHDLMNSGSVGA